MLNSRVMVMEIGNKEIVLRFVTTLSLNWASPSVQLSLGERNQQTDMINLLKFYNKWNIHGLVLLSLCLQIILLLFAPFRKRSINRIIIAPIWLAYVLADLVATYAIGLISNHRGYSLNPNDDRAAILAFWAAFLLLHLGGPDNVSAFSLEDNTLWERHLFALISQVVSTFIVIIEPLPRKKLWISTVLVFIAGTIKYGERICALYFANLSKYKECLIAHVPKPDYKSILDKWVEKPKAEAEVVKVMLKERLSDDKVVASAHKFLRICKGLIADIIPKEDVDNSKNCFLSWHPTDAFRVLEVELNLIYEVFYTKFVVLYLKRGWILRVISWCAIVVALLIFYSTDKHDFRSIDVKVTYALLFCAIGLDMVALFMIAISDWTVVYVQKLSEDKSWKGSLSKYFHGFLVYLLTLKRTKQVSDVSKFVCFDWVRKFLFGFFYWVRRVLFWRWSGSLHTFNFIDYCLKERHLKKSIGISFLKSFYVSKEPIEEKLWNFIFTQLKVKAENEGKQQDSNLNKSSKKLWSHSGDDYYKTLLIWHIATDLCHENNKLECLSAYRGISKILSDYMLYLLVIQPTLMSAVSGIVKIRFRDTCGETNVLLNKYVPEIKGRKKERAELYEKCLRIDIPQTRANLKNDKSELVLLEAFAIVQHLETLCPEKRWKLISEVWVELLSYAAGHSRADMHIAQLSQGGEFITFVWLLMAHFGLRNNFQSYKGIDNILDNYMSQCTTIRS